MDWGPKTPQPSLDLTIDGQSGLEELESNRIEVKLKFLHVNTNEDEEEDVEELDISPRHASSRHHQHRDSHFFNGGVYSSSISRSAVVNSPRSEITPITGTSR